MEDKKEKYDEHAAGLRTYDSPSRSMVTTPIRGALRSSKNNAFIFLGKLKELNRFKTRLEKLDIKRKEGKENDETL